MARRSGSGARAAGVRPTRPAVKGYAGTSRGGTRPVNVFEDGSVAPKRAVRPRRVSTGGAGQRRGRS